MNVRPFTSVKERRVALETETGVRMPAIGTFVLDESTASTRNCENMIGAIQVPVGVAGPLAVRRFMPKDERKDYYIPLATTEGALIASVNRGCKAISEAGGAIVDSYRVGATRGPVFRVSGLEENSRLRTFLKQRFTDLQSVTKATSGHITLLKCFSRGIGRYRYVRFVFNTQDAMGMNMVTVATDSLVGFIEKETGIRCLSVAGNYDIDKKPAWLNIIEGRGIQAWAEAVIPEKILETVLKTTAQRVFDVWLSKCMLGSMMAGSMAFNAHTANIIAALFLATGQDMAHISEGSLGVTTTEVLIGNDGSRSLYISIHLPDLMVGTVGGGTHLATQYEALSLLGVAGGDDGAHALCLAEITGAAVLAGELSLLSSLEEGTLAKAHQKLGRGKR